MVASRAGQWSWNGSALRDRLTMVNTEENASLAAEYDGLVNRGPCNGTGFAQGSQG